MVTIFSKTIKKIVTTAKISNVVTQPLIKNIILKSNEFVRE